MKIPELLLIDKPSGITSFDVIRQLRKKLGIRKMGHAGTLDPLATGLMIIGIEKGTKQLKHYVGLDKTYEATILLGKKSETGDREGEIVEEKEIPKLNKDQIKEAVESMKGPHTLPVSLYSAMKRKGKPLYKYVRSGEEVVQPIRVMDVLSVEVTQIELPKIFVTLEVSSGTYIRSLAEELGERLGTVALLYDLRRTKVGEHVIADAEQLNSI